MSKYSIISFRSRVNIWKRTCPMTDSCGILRITSIQVDYNALDSTFWALACNCFFYPGSCLPNQTLKSLLVYKNIVGYSTKSVAKVDVNDIQCSPCPQIRRFIMEGSQEDQTWFILDESMMTIPSHLCLLCMTRNVFQKVFLHDSPACSFDLSSLFLYLLFIFSLLC